MGRCRKTITNCCASVVSQVLVYEALFPGVFKGDCRLASLLMDSELDGGKGYAMAVRHASASIGR